MLLNYNPWDKKNRYKNGFDINMIIDFFNKMFGTESTGPKNSNFFNKKRWMFIALVPLILWLGSGFYKLFPYEEALVLRFGKWVRTENPGLNYHLPYPIEMIQKVPTGTIHRMDIGVPSGTQALTSVDEHIMLTGDENVLHIGLSLSWQIRDLSQFVLISQNPVDTLKVAAESVLREIIGQTKTAPIISRSGWNDINLDIQKRLQVLVDKYQIGIRIVNVELHTALPPQPVADSFAEVQRAKTYQEQVVNEAFAYANDKIPKARGECAQIIQAAEANAAKIVNLAKGNAERFNAIYEEYRKDPDLNKKRLYYEMMSEILSENTKKQIFDKAFIKSGIVPLLNLNQSVQGK